jgi:hypothetical protein
MSDNSLFCLIVVETNPTHFRRRLGEQLFELSYFVACKVVFASRSKYSAVILGSISSPE